MSKSFNKIALGDLFQDDYRYALEKVCHSLQGNPGEEEPVLLVSDSIDVETLENSVKVHVVRNVFFDPESIFSVEVGYVAELYYKEDTAKIIKKNQDKLKSRFIQEGDFVLSNLMSRVALLIAQITSSSGFQPLITPPSLDLSID